MLKKQRLIKIFLPSLFFLAVMPTYAQGGKAEPLRIEFKPGARSAAVAGRIRNDEQAEYVFAAREGQRISIALVSIPARTARFTLMDADGAALKFEHNGRHWTGRAPRTGDFLVYVARSGASRGSTNYSLKVRIE